MKFLLLSLFLSTGLLAEEKDKPKEKPAPSSEQLFLESLNDISKDNGVDIDQARGDLFKLLDSFRVRLNYNVCGLTTSYHLLDMFYQARINDVEALKKIKKMAEAIIQRNESQFSGVSPTCRENLRLFSYEVLKVFNVDVLNKPAESKKEEILKEEPNNPHVQKPKNLNNLILDQVNNEKNK